MKQNFPGQGSNQPLDPETSVLNIRQEKTALLKKKKKKLVKHFYLIEFEKIAFLQNNGEKVLTIVIFVHLQGFHPTTKRNDTLRLVIF